MWLAHLNVETLTRSSSPAMKLDFSERKEAKEENFLIPTKKAFTSDITRPNSSGLPHTTFIETDSFIAQRKTAPVQHLPVTYQYVYVFDAM